MSQPEGPRPSASDQPSSSSSLLSVKCSNCDKELTTEEQDFTGKTKRLIHKKCNECLTKERLYRKQCNDNEKNRLKVTETTRECEKCHEMKPHNDFTDPDPTKHGGKCSICRANFNEKYEKKRSKEDKNLRAHKHYQKIRKTHDVENEDEDEEENEENEDKEDNEDEDEVVNRECQSKWPNWNECRQTLTDAEKNYKDKSGKDVIKHMCTPCRERLKKVDNARHNKKVQTFKNSDPNNPICARCLLSKPKAEYFNGGHSFNKCIECRKYIYDNIESKRPERDHAESSATYNHSEHGKEIRQKWIDDNTFKRRQNSSIQRGIKSELTNEEFNEIISKNCYCCNQQNTGKNMVRDDCRLGRNKTNCLSSCKMCSVLKCCLSVNIFIKICQHILKFNGLDLNNKFELDYKLFCNYSGLTFPEYSKQATERGIKFELTKTEFFNEIQKSCYICGKENSNVHQNGLDRINSLERYHGQNVKACCGTCNYLKKYYTLNDFLEHCKRVCLVHPDKINITDYTLNRLINKNIVHV